MTTKKKEVDLAQYETSIKKVEGIISKLREGKITLDESLKQYEEGVSLIKECMHAIESMEKKITLLTEKDGKTQETPFE